MSTSLTGKTIFITGSSRGIGLAIAKRAAREGANIIVAAKTTEPHHSLPGTIYTAAEEIEQAGGKALAVKVDIRDEAVVEDAVKQAVERFGGIDILINNASAISLTGTLQTSMKRFDLMHGVNVRGTYLTSRACLPHLLKSDNPHILNISPPLNMFEHWFENHVAYTMAKYGMSMCVLGMAGEFKGQVGVNALWPKTAIATSAVSNVIGDQEMMNQCRTPEIMADAAYHVLTRDAKTSTGNFFIDEDIILESGETDLDQYAVKPGEPLLPDFFL